jgi:hypothetical protein
VIDHPALRSWIAAMGLPDALALATSIAAVDGGSLTRWFTTAERAADAMVDGGRPTVDALVAVRGAWTALEPPAALERILQAQASARSLVRSQVWAAERAAATIAETQRTAAADTDAAERRLRSLGDLPDLQQIFPAWTSDQQLSGSVTAAVLELVTQLERHRSDVEQTLSILRDSIEADPTGCLTTVADGPGAIAPPPTSRALALDDLVTTNQAAVAADRWSADPATRTTAAGVVAAVAEAQAGGPADLLLYEPAHDDLQGRAAIVVGDLADADHVAILVPGVANSPAAMGDSVTDAAALQHQMTQDSGDGAAVVVWFGYDIPFSTGADGIDGAGPWWSDAVAAADSAAATAGGARLAQDVASWAPVMPSSVHLTAVGFSAGSTTASAAATHPGVVDDLVLMGSPGAGAQVSDVSDYPDAGDGHTYVLALDADPITRWQTDVVAGTASAVRGAPGSLLDWVTGSRRASDVRPTAADGYGPDPARTSFGAQRLDDDPDDDPDGAPDELLPAGTTWVDRATGGTVTGLVGGIAGFHSQSTYLAGERGRQVSRVATGRYDEVRTEPGR